MPKSIKSVKLAINEISETIQSFYDKQEELKNLLSDLVRDHIRNEKLLKDTIWQYHASKSLHNYFLAEDQDLIEKLVGNIIPNDGLYHFSFELDDGVIIRCDDFEWSLCIDANNVGQFVNTHGVRLKTDNIQSQIKLYEHEIKQLEIIVESV